MAEQHDNDQEDEDSSKKKKHEIDEEHIDEALEETFPASDPPAY